MVTKRILVVSDMHVVRPGCQDSKINTALLELPVELNPVESLKRLINDSDLQIDYLLNLGDVTDKAYVDGWITGIRLLREIKNECNISTLLHVLGNHDLTLDLNDHQEFYLPRHTRDFPLSDKQLSEDYWNKGYCIFADDTIVYLLCNSETIYMSKDDLDNSPVFLEDFNKELNEKLNRYDGNGRIKIALMHRHVVPHSDLYNKSYKEDVIRNADCFLDVLKKHGFNMVIHGHKHQARFVESNGIFILASGSISSRMNLLEQNGNNLVHILTLDIDDNKLCGYIDTYKYAYNTGWINETDSQDCFNAHIGFGFNGSVEDLANNIINMYGTELEARNSISYKTIVAAFHECLYLSKDQDAQLEALLAERNYKFCTDKGIKFLTKLIML